MRFIVLGAGAIGGVVGGRLAQHGHDVVLVARGAHGKAIAADGLLVRSPDDEVRVAVPVVDHASAVDLTDDDVVLLTGAAPHLARVRGAGDVPCHPSRAGRGRQPARPGGRSARLDYR